MLGGSYDRGYKRLLTYLRDSRCTFSHRTSGSGTANYDDANTGADTTTITPTKQHRPRPHDHNICLSIYDMQFLKMFPASTPQGGSYSSKTTELNSIANAVGRTMLFGGRPEKNKMASYLGEYARVFATKWGVGEKGDSFATQEVNFIRVLQVLLKEDLAAAEAVSSFTGGSNSGNGNGSGDGDGNGCGDSCVTATSTASTSSEYGCSKYGDESGISTALHGGIGAVTGLDQPPLRLYDAYQNAFHRVVEMCLMDSNKQDFSPAQNEEIWLSFLDWEQSLRRNLTSEMWMQHPAELVGEWRLVDFSGTGDLKSIMTAAREELLLQHGAGGAAQQGVSVSTTILYVIMGSTSGSDPNFTSVLVVVLSFY